MSIAAGEAASHAKLPWASDRQRIGVSIGSYGEDPPLEEIVWLHRFYDGEGHWDLEGLAREGGYNFLRFYRRKPDMISAMIARLFDCRGPNLSSTSACAAGAQAVGEAFRMIQDGHCDVMIAGGCDSTLNLAGFLGFVLLGAVAVRYETPQTASRPFDRKRNGFVLSEGAAVLILENFDHARNRGAPIEGEILGYGSSSDAYRITDSDPRGEGVILAMRKALADAGLGVASLVATGVVTTGLGVAAGTGAGTGSCTACRTPKAINHPTPRLHAVTSRSCWDSRSRLRWFVLGRIAGSV